MRLCQPEHPCTVSCGACCGILNLLISNRDKKRLLQERTDSFSKNVDFSKRYTIPAYRQERENLEKDIPKKDITIYACPFLGYLPDSIRIGCMIHPVYTQDPLSQNYSFYGSSICLAYTCKNYDNKNSVYWQNLMEEIASDSVEYSRLAGDHITIHYIENLFSECSISVEEMFSKYREVLKEILSHSANSEFTQWITSFEIDMQEGMKDRDFYKLLMERLHIQKRPSLGGYGD